MPMKRISNIEIENAQLYFRNFAGKPDNYNRNGGVRYFGVFIDDNALAHNLAEDGWNIKYTRPTDPNVAPRAYMRVAINYNYRIPPHIVMISGRKHTDITEDMIECLDSATIKNLDLTIRPRVRDEDGETKVTAYLDEMYVVTEQSRWAQKYAEEEYPCDDDDLPM